MDFEPVTGDGSEHIPSWVFPSPRGVMDFELVVLAMTFYVLLVFPSPRGVMDFEQVVSWNYF